MMEEVPVFSVDSRVNIHLEGMVHRKREIEEAQRTCRCLTIPAVTICIGVFYLILYTFVLSLYVGLLMFDANPETTSIKPSTEVIVMASIHILSLLLLLFGTVREKHLCLFPFFLLRVLEFSMFMLTTLWLYLRHAIRGEVFNTPDLDMSLPDEDLGINPDLQSYLVWLSLAGRVYTIWIVYKRYKYLKSRRNEDRSSAGFSAKH